MKVIFICGFEETYWDNVKYLTDGCDVLHICPPRITYDDIALSQQLFIRKQEDILLEMNLKGQLSPDDIILIVDHQRFDFKKWEAIIKAKLVGLYEHIPLTLVKKFKYKTYKYKTTKPSPPTLPIISLPEVNFKIKRDRVAILYSREQDSDSYSYIDLIIERFPQYEFVFLFEYLDNTPRLIEELSLCKAVLHCSRFVVIDKQHYITALGCGCCLIMPRTNTFETLFPYKWFYSGLFIGMPPKKKTKKKFWSKRINQIKLHDKLFGYIDFSLRGYNFRQFDTVEDYQLLKTTYYLSGEEFLNKLICL